MPKSVITLFSILHILLNLNIMHMAAICFYTTLTNTTRCKFMISTNMTFPDDKYQQAKQTQNLSTNLEVYQGVVRVVWWEKMRMQNKFGYKKVSSHIKC